MPSSWDVYYVIFLSSVMAMGIPVLFLIFTFLIRPKKVRFIPEKSKPKTVISQKVILGKKMNARYAVGINASLIFITMTLFLIPCVAVLPSSRSSNSGPEPRDLQNRALIVILSMGFLTGLGLIYCIRKGDLSWGDVRNDLDHDMLQESPHH